MSTLQIPMLQIPCYRQYQFQGKPLRYEVHCLKQIRPPSSWQRWRPCPMRGRKVSHYRQEGFRFWGLQTRLRLFCWWTQGFRLHHRSWFCMDSERMNRRSFHALSHCLRSVRRQRMQYLHLCQQFQEWMWPFFYHYQWKQSFYTHRRSLQVHLHGCACPKFRLR